MLWDPTIFDECVATVHNAVAAGINLLDLAPRYGGGKAEEVAVAAANEWAGNVGRKLWKMRDRP